jgi:hypothetical protein
MKALIPLLIVSTSALAVTTVQYAQRAGTERRRADEAQIAVQNHEARIRELQQAQNNLQEQLQQRARPPSEPVASSAQVAAPTPNPAPRRAGLQARGFLARAEPAISGGVEIRGGPMPFMAMEQQLSPAAQRYMRQQMKAGLRRQYEDLGPALGMSPEQSSKLIDLLSEQQSRSMAEPRKLNVDMKEAMQAARETQKRNYAEIAALIGQDKVPLWEDYQKSLPERSQVNMIREQMENMGVPITDDQRARLLEVVMEERQSNPRPMPSEGLPPEEMFAQSMKWQEEADKALLERAKTVLTPEQYQHYRDYQQWQSEMRNNSMRSFRAGPGGVMGLATSSSYAVTPDPPPEK